MAVIEKCPKIEWSPKSMSLHFKNKNIQISHETLYKIIFYFKDNTLWCFEIWYKYLWLKKKGILSEGLY